MTCLRPTICFIATLLLGASGQASNDAAPNVPFVPAFDRFGLHADIDPSTAGRLLISELSCTACHKSKEVLLDPKRGPVLDAVGSRVRFEWIRDYLLNPAEQKPGTTMPDMLSALPPAQRSDAAASLAAFLASLTQPFPEIKATGANPVPMEFWKKGNAQHGRQLFHQIGCVACHEPDGSYDVVAIQPSPLDQLLEQLEPDELREMGLSSAARRVNSVPLPVVAQKYTNESLTHFLLNPQQVRPSGRMPNLSLLAVDAADIAEWLMTRDQALAVPQPADNARGDDAGIQSGRQLFVQLGCVNCHDVKGLKPEASVASLESLNLSSPLSCIQATADDSSIREPANQTQATRKAGQPLFELSSAQESALRSFSSGELQDETEMRLLQSNCYACHERNSMGGVGRFRKPYFETVGHVDIGDEGRLPPALTGVGRRLTVAALNSVLTGKGNIRPHMTIRMPVFPASVTKSLPALITMSDGQSARPLPADAVFAKGDRNALIEAGRQLMDTGCVQCHAFRGETLPGTVGVDLEGATKRVNAEWLHDFLKDPGALKPRTRMPTFFPNGRSQNSEVLDGDVELQIAAMYAYLNDLPNQPLPAKIQEARAQDYELTPKDRPIVIRTFMPAAGMHAIAVGFPQHVHFAFDAENLSLAQAWRGRFLDAEGTWFVRFAPPADPLGEHQVLLPPGIVVSELKDMNSQWPDNAEKAGATFQGYRLNKDGTPTFLYRLKTCNLEDRIEPDGDGGLRRTMTLTQSSSTESSSLWLRMNQGLKLEPDARSDGAYINDQGVTVSVEESLSSEIRTREGTVEQIAPITVHGQRPVTIHLRYRW
ncbi:MAG: cytochrome c [Planctomycetaceae bacterium]